MNTFYQAVANVLEVDSVGYDTDFRQISGWCSLQGFGLLVLLENDFESPMDVETFLNMHTVGDLYAWILAAFAAKILRVPRESITNETAYDSIPEWDSVAHLRLVMEVEARFATHYALETIPNIKTIRDLAREGN